MGRGDRTHLRVCVRLYVRSIRRVRYNGTGLTLSKCMATCKFFKFYQILIRRQVEPPGTWTQLQLLSCFSSSKGVLLEN